MTEQTLRPRLIRWLWSLLITGLSLPLALIVGAQEPLDLSHFDGADQWPLYAPGDLTVDTGSMTAVTVAYDGVFATPEGPLELLTTIDFNKAMFRGVPATWMLWTFTSEQAGDHGVPSLDLLVMERKTGALRYRMAPTKPRSDWGGPYSFVGVEAGELRRTEVPDEGPSKNRVVSIERPLFDFGGLPFVLPFLDLRKGQGLRLHAYQQSAASGVQLLNVKVIGETTITDSRGQRHQALEIQSLAPSRSSRVSFFVSNKAPYFLGWDYRNVADGSSLFKMTYRGFQKSYIGR
ncbi:MAG: hypothetical protein AAF604_21230 [Acidobacteriota bacterium]